MSRTEWIVARTKFGVPQIPNAVVPRGRLVRRLHDGSGQALTVVTAAPGSGKTALLSHWVDELTEPVAWLSCDSDDADPGCLWHDVGTAVQDAWRPFGSIAAGVLGDWGSRQAALELANELASLGQDGVIVLDDFHLAGADPDVWLTFVAALPRGVRLVIGARSDPPFPVARMRIQGDLLELRQEDLRFTADETRELLAALGVELDDAGVEQIQATTEGWAAAIQLAALSLPADGNRAGFLHGMLDTDRSLVDFLVNEVIDRQPPEIREFLLVTAELETFDAQLCTAVCGWSDTQMLLDRVRRANLFLVELPGSTGTYRYHHLFGQFLRGRLRATAPERVHAIHKAAAEAYRERADPLPAVRHRMQAGGPDSAFDDLQEYLISELSADDRSVALGAARSLLAEFGTTQLSRSPIKLLDCVIALNTVGGAASETELWLRRISAREPDIDLSAQLVLHGAWSFYHLHQGDPERALREIRTAQDVLERGPVNTQWLRALPNMVIQAQLWLADLDAALDEVETLRRAGLAPVASEVRAAGFEAHLRAVHGELFRAESCANAALRAADQLGLGEQNFGRAEPLLALALIHTERDQRDDAQSCLDQVMRIAEGGRRPPVEVLALLLQARLDVRCGDADAAADCLHRARHVFPNPQPPVVARIDEVAARVALDCGDLPVAATLCNRLPAAPITDLLRARLALAGGQPAGARAALANVPPTGPVREQLERAILMARALAQDDPDGAHAVLQEALIVAQRAGFFRIIVDEGPQLWSLLESLPARSDTADYVLELLDAARRAVPAAHAGATQDLIDPLSAREVTVLRYLASQLDSTQIASAMYLSVNTVRTHVKSIYRKLGVNSRLDAVQRGRALDLI